MSPTLKETKVISDIAGLLYRFLPGTPHPYASADISFPGVANKLHLSHFWVGGSKKPAIIQLLQATLDTRRNQFCYLIIEIVKMGITYLSNKNKPVTREEIIKLNRLITQLNFKIPELSDPAFLDSLPSSKPVDKVKPNAIDPDMIEKLKQDLISLTGLEAHQRGFLFEKFLNEMFAVYNLEPRSSFRIVGEQIDGSFQIGTDVYLVEAKWHDKQIDQSHLLIFHGKVEGKSRWSRGLYVSYSGFSPEGLIAYSRGRPTNIIGMDSQDLFFILSGEMSLVEAINRKARRAAETGEFFVSVYTLSHGG
ncbi:MAG: restriction endonuclease [Chloroflexota bacterium]